VIARFGTTAAGNSLQAASPNSFHILFSSSWSSVGILLVSPSSFERSGTKRFQMHLLDVPLPIGQPTVGGDSFICSNVSDEHYGIGLGVLTIPLNSIAASTTNYIPTNGHGFDSIGSPSIFPVIFRPLYSTSHNAQTT
jgi:hypothetical protein